MTTMQKNYQSCDFITLYYYLCSANGALHSLVMLSMRRCVKNTFDYNSQKIYKMK